MLKRSANYLLLCVKECGINTRPNPIAAGHFSAYHNRAVSKAERVDSAHPGGLNGVDDVFPGRPDDGLQQHFKRETSM